MRPLIPSPRQNTCSKAYEDHDAGTRGLTSAWKRSMVRNLSAKDSPGISKCPFTISLVLAKWGIRAGTQHLAVLTYSSGLHMLEQAAVSSRSGVSVIDIPSKE